MVYRKFKRTWSHGFINYIPKFRETFPELNKLNSEELCDRFDNLNMEFYYEEPTPVSKLLRWTLPFAITLMVLMIIFMPFKFMITGSWGYSLGKKNKILNWFKALHLQ